MNSGSDGGDHFALSIDWVNNWKRLNCRILRAVVDPEDLIDVSLTEIYQDLFNTVPNVAVRNFNIGRATLSPGGYQPGEFPFDFDPELSFNDLLARSNHLLVVSFDIEVTGLSRIKARGVGEIEVIRTRDGSLRIRARDGWNIEEVMEIEIDEDGHEFDLVEKLESIIQQLIIAFIVETLLEFIRRAVM